MAMSSGVRQAVGLAVGWLLVAATSAVGVLRFAELKDATRGLTGVTAAEPAYAASSGRSRRQWELERRPPSGRVVELKAGTFGHYRAQAEINGRPVEVLVDSGASLVVLSHDDAERAGLNIRAGDYTQRVSTANGPTRVAPMLLDRVSIGDITRAQCRGGHQRTGQARTIPARHDIPGPATARGHARGRSHPAGISPAAISTAG